jgi:penicillin-binding protein 2
MMRVGEFREDLVARLRLLSGVVVALLVAIAASFWFVQVVQGGYYRDLAENNRLRRLPVKAPRGVIYDRHGRPLVENVPSYNLLLDRSRVRLAEASLEFAGRILGRPAAELRALLERYRAIPEFTPVLLAENLALSQVARFAVENLEHPEFEIDVDHLRLYRHGQQAAHALGYLGETGAEEVRRGFAPGDLVGKKGVEQAYDTLLRGRGGERVVVVDSRGRVLEEHPAAEPGHDLHLTLDLELQQEAERYLRERVGAVVALDPRTGEILVMASSPAFDPNLFARRLRPADWHALVTAPHQPLQNRTLQNTYAPGSVFKIVMAMAGLAEGAITPSESVYCGGAATFYGHSFRCWKRAGHGRVNVHQALRDSCDVYFYHLGRQLGVERIARYARLLGLGERAGVDVSGEKAGLVPDEPWSLKVRGYPWYPGETISVAIGQGPLLVTPLQVAVLMAQVANGGRRVTPHLVRDGAGARPPEPVPLPAATLGMVREALRAVVQERGTGAAAGVTGLEIAGKTSTVQVVAQKTWTENQALREEHRDHAWFASFAPYADPRLVVVVFIEHGGRGSQAAAPLAKILYETYFRTALRDHQPA